MSSFVSGELGAEFDSDLGSTACCDLIGFTPLWDIKDINDIVARVLNVDGTFPNRAGDWVLIHEITEGNWGVSGQTVGIKDIHSVTQGSPERIDYFLPLLAAQNRMLATHGYPVGAPGSGK